MSMPMGPFRTHSVPVNVGALAAFEAGSVVDADALAASGLVKNNANRDWPVKLLAQGEIDRALTIRVHAASAAARAKVEAAGGTVELIGEAGPAD
jgi:large subunit ribosomal protein L15